MTMLRKTLLSILGFCACSIMTLESCALEPIQHPHNQSYLKFATPIPGKIEAEHFDRGGDGVAYHNVTNIKRLNSSQDCERPQSSIEVEQVGELCVVSKTAYHEWMRYTIEVIEDGSYDVAVKYSNAGPTGSLILSAHSLDNPLQEIDIPSTGNEKSFSTLSFQSVSLKKGIYPVYLGFSDKNKPSYNDTNTALIMQLVGSTSNAQLDFIEITSSKHSLGLENIQIDEPVEVHNVPGVIQAGGDFDPSMEGKTFKDNSVENTVNPAHHSVSCGEITSVEVERRRDVCVLTQTEPGEWLNYNFKVEREGYYDILLSTFSESPGGRFYLQMNGRGVTPALSVKSSATTLTPNVEMISKIFMPKGINVLKLVMLSAGDNGFVGDFAHIEVLDHFNR